jgi:hypothetical protein
MRDKFEAFRLKNIFDITRITRSNPLYSNTLAAIGDSKNSLSFTSYECFSDFTSHISSYSKRSGISLPFSRDRDFAHSVISYAPVHPPNAPTTAIVTPIVWKVFINKKL